MQRKYIPLFIAAGVLAVHPATAMAYIGPGVGAGAIAAVIGVVGSIFLAIVAVLYYPIKRMLKGSKAKSAKAAAGSKSAK